MKKKLKVLTIANRKGGAGKSTCAAHIALEAVSAGLKVLLLDLDPQKTLECWWNLREDENPYMSDTLAKELSDKITSVEEKGFDLCIIDTPGDVSINSTASIQVADLVLIPSKPTAPDLGAIGRTITMVKDTNKPFVFLITQAISRSNAALQAMSVLSEFGTVAPSIISNRVSYAKAMSAGTSASEHDSIAKEEMLTIWNFIEKKLQLNKGKSNGKEKI